MNENYNRNDDDGNYKLLTVVYDNKYKESIILRKISLVLGTTNYKVKKIYNEWDELRSENQFLIDIQCFENDYSYVKTKLESLVFLGDIIGVY